MVNRAAIKLVTRLFMMLLMAALSTACFHISKEINGRVVDAETHQPLEGVIIVASWSSLGISGHGKVYIHLAESVTDAEGYFTLPRILDLYIAQPPDYSQPRLFIFKEGYVPYHIRNKLEGYRDINDKSFHLGERSQTVGLVKYKKRYQEPEDFGKYTKVVRDVWRDAGLSSITSQYKCVFKELPTTTLVFNKLVQKYSESGLEIKINQLPSIWDQAKCREPLDEFLENNE